VSAIFAITAASARVQLDPARRAEVAFTVSNRSGCALRARLLTRVQEGASGSWLTLDGELERELAADATVQVRIMVAVPADAPTGSYAFRLDVVGVANPDEHVSAGQWVALEVPPALHGQPSRFPWWLLLIAGGIAAAAGTGLAFGLHHWLPAAIGAGLGVALAMIGLVIRAHGDAAPASAAPPRAEAPAAPVVEIAVTPVAASPLPAPQPTPQPRAEPLPAPADPAPAPPLVPTPAPCPVPAPSPVVGRPSTTPPAAAAAARMIMPRLIGWQQQDAAKAIAALGLVLGPVEQQQSASPVGTVLDHRPSERQSIAKGDLASLVVAAPATAAEGGQS
jgi:hypothetical protein